MSKILTKFAAIILFAVYAIVTASGAFAHGGDGVLPKPEPIQEEVSENEGTSLLPYAIGGSVVVIGAVTGLALWQRTKES